MKNEEEKEQEVVVKYLHILQKQGKIIEFHSVQNETPMRGDNVKKNIAIAVKAKAMGKKRGVPDLFIYFTNFLLQIEMKKRRKKLKNGTYSRACLLSDEQKDFCNKMIKTEYAVYKEVYGAKEAMALIDLAHLENMNTTQQERQE